MIICRNDWLSWKLYLNLTYHYFSRKFLSANLYYLVTVWKNLLTDTSLNISETTYIVASWGNTILWQFKIISCYYSRKINFEYWQKTLINGCIKMYDLKAFYSKSKGVAKWRSKAHK